MQTLQTERYEDQKIWLIKSSNRILGPFSSEEVKNEIKARNVSIVDEIQASGSRWRYIREEQAFIDVVKSLRLEQENAREDTMTSSVTSQTITQTDTIEMTGADVDISAQTQVRKSDSFGSETKASPIRRAPPMQGTQATQTKSYGLSHGGAVEKSLKKSTYAIWAVCLLVLALIGFFTYDKILQKTAPGLKGRSFEELRQLGFRARSLGFYDKALAFLKQAEKMSPQDQDNNFNLALLEIVLEKQTLSGRRKLETVLTQKTDRVTGAEGYTAIGLSYALEGDLKSAQDSYSRALSLDEKYWQAQFNQSMTQAAEQQFEAALATLSAIEIKAQNELILSLMKGIFSLELAKKDKSYISNSEEVFEKLRVLTEKTSEFRQEIFLLLAKKASMQKDLDAVAKYLQQFLQADPYSTDEYVAELLVDRRFMNWTYLNHFCSDIVEQTEVSSGNLAFKSICLTKAGEQMKAQSLIQQALAQTPKNHVILAVSAYLNKESGREAEAKSNLKMSMQEGSSFLSFNLLARQCNDENQVNCSRNAWNRVLVMNPQSVEAFSGLAWLAHGEKNTFEMRKQMEQGLSLSHNYRPLLELREMGSL